VEKTSTNGYPLVPLVTKSHTKWLFDTMFLPPTHTKGSSRVKIKKVSPS
jgi:hypothetical protein